MSRTVEQLLADARARLDRVTPERAQLLREQGAYLVDTRPEWQRAQEGSIPGALVIERNHLEWRLDPTSGARIPEAVDHDVTWIVFCSEGYASSLAAASLQDLGLRNATDLVGGFQAWRSWVDGDRSGSSGTVREAQGARSQGVEGAVDALDGDRVAGAHRVGVQRQP